MRKGSNEGIPARDPAVLVKVGPFFGEADLDIAQGAAGVADDAAHVFVRLGQVANDRAKFLQTPFQQRREFADHKAATRVGVWFIEGVPEADAIAQRTYQL